LHGNQTALNAIFLLICRPNEDHHELFLISVQHQIPLRQLNLFVEGIIPKIKLNFKGSAHSNLLFEQDLHSVVDAPGHEHQEGGSGVLGDCALAEGVDVVNVELLRNDYVLKGCQFVELLMLHLDNFHVVLTLVLNEG
jgi:hypothetical protein